MALTKERYLEIGGRLASERPLIRKRLDMARQLFYEAPCEETLMLVTDELIYWYMYHMTLNAPIMVTPTGIISLPAMVEGAGPVKQVFTSAEELRGLRNESIGVLYVRGILDEIVEEKRLAGLVLDPMHESPSRALLFLHRDRIEYIVGTARASIEAQPEEVREVMLHPGRYRE